ncbi:MAG: tetratricopeptide repeat protein [Candidatus Hydrogenedentes bacterium]|nr:tetratricopeptide repeat protein [Candidatus Hydrogenedentota bacterium]
MEALISGETGLAVAFQGNDSYLFDVNHPSKSVPIPQHRVQGLFQFSYDLKQIDIREFEDLEHILREAWTKARVFRLLLLLLEEGDSDVKLEAASFCEDAFADGDVLDSTSKRLFSAPIPGGLPDDVFNYCETNSKTFQILTTVREHQEQIRLLRYAWDQLAEQEFPSAMDAAEFLEALIESGSIREIVTASDDPAMFGAARFLCHTSVSQYRNSRSIVDTWLGPFFPPKVKRQQLPISPEIGELPNQRPGKRGHVSVHKLYTSVTHQKDIIKSLMKEGDLDRVRSFTQQLVQTQLRTSEPQYAAKSLCDLAQEAKLLKQHSLQLELAQKAVDINPGDGWAHGQVADAFFCLLDFNNAIYHFQQADSYGQETFAKSGQARVLRAQGNLRQALELYTQLLTQELSDQDELLTACARAEVLRDLEKYPEALQAFKDAAARFPDAPLPSIGIGVVLKDMGQLNESLAAYSGSKVRFPEESAAYAGFADVLKELGQLEDAYVAYEEASLFFRNEVIIYCGRADILRRLGRIEAAFRAYEEAIRCFPNDSSPLHGLLQMLVQNGEMERAARAFENAIEKFPRDCYLRNSRAEFLKQYGGLRQGLQAYDETLLLFPGDLFALSARAEILKEMGAHKKAIDAYQRLLEIKPHKERLRHSLAAVLVLSKRYNEAENLIGSGEPRTRSQWVAHHIRGMILLKKGKIDEAILWFRESLERVPFAPEREYFAGALAVALLKKRRFQGAIDAVGDANTPFANVLRIHALGEMQRKTDALHRYQMVTQTCPEPLAVLRDELAARFRLVHSKPRQTNQWIYDQEVRAAMLQAA